MNTELNIFGLTRAELEETLVDMGEKAFHGRQLYKWIYKHRVFDFSEMTDIRLDLRAMLNREFSVDLPSIADSRKSSDGTEKFLFRLADGKMIESVLIEDDSSGRMTLCVSSQVGCALGCRFCATGYLGFDRNLTVGEILAQPLIIRNLYGEEAFDNLVFMGMGEPMLNYDRVMAAIEIMTDSLGLMIGAKRITISTSGVVPGIRWLAQSSSKVHLALSLNAANDKLRRKLMPVAKSYPLPKIMEAVREWTTVRKRRVTFEYILFKGINDGDENALALAELIRGIPCKINLLAYNLVDGVEYQRPDDEDIDRFARVLYPRTPAVTVRKSRGGDIDAACGQLAGRKK
ncbi:MAG: 23S rRNA (adenine(2503)-C(2))-methyltransferase RlmN [FCB group bacterium]|nr:23S rRNA (adenine(2503)-C(2))-methyltransferase RlmN [FCB group bacterium]